MAHLVKITYVDGLTEDMTFDVETMRGALEEVLEVLILADVVKIEVIGKR